MGPLDVVVLCRSVGETNGKAGCSALLGLVDIGERVVDGWVRGREEGAHQQRYQPHGRTASSHASSTPSVSLQLSPSHDGWIDVPKGPVGLQ